LRTSQIATQGGRPLKLALDKQQNDMMTMTGSERQKLQNCKTT